VKVISGGQTGVDRGALDAAMARGTPHGGWCPRGRLAEDGAIPGRYGLRETTSSEYPARTEQNVLDSDATLIISRGDPRGGTELTVRLVKKHDKPCWIVDLNDLPDEEAALINIRRWLRSNDVEVLNVAGPRESQNLGIAAAAEQFVGRLLEVA
jgi:hypothetical protein